MNKLFYGDNLTILRQYIPDESIDLIYLDPPFNSNRNYNILFKDESGNQSAAQINAFEDTWHWDINTEAIYQELTTAHHVPPQVSDMIAALRAFIGANQMMAYLTNMTIRLVELHRVLKPTGSLYLHCDPTASHYLKIVLDAIFGFENFHTELIWKRSGAHNDTKQGAKQPGRIHDVILFYSKTNDWLWNPVFTAYDEDYLKTTYSRVDPNTGRRFKASDLSAAKGGGDTSYEWKGNLPPNGRYWAYSKENMQKFEDENRIYYSSTGKPYLKQYLDEMPGKHIQSIWDDIPPISAQSAEKLGYPTQKPQALLERIIAASSNPGDVVLDPFCGCGTAVAAAQALDRRWIGIDITHLAITLIKYRIEDAFPEARFTIEGEPESIDAALYLAESDRFQFEWWALSLVRARPVGGSGGRTGKKGADRGIDGIINFIDDQSAQPKTIIIQVKSGHVNAATIRDLIGTVNNSNAAIGVLLTLEEPTRPMHEAAAQAGFYHSELWERNYPRIQILTIDQLLNGASLQMPPTGGAADHTFKRAQRHKKDDPTQPDLFGG